MTQFYRTFEGFLPCHATLRISVVVMALGLVAAAEVDAQEDLGPRTAFLDTLDVRVVNVEVFVTDRKGRPRLDLGRDDFEVFEDGKRVELVNFLSPSEMVSPTSEPEVLNSAATTRSIRTPTETVEPATVQVAQGSSAPAGTEEATHHVVLFIDNLNIAPHSRKRVVDRLREIVREQGRPGIRFLVATYDGRVEIRQGFTDEMERVEAALEGLDRLSGPALARQNERLALLREGQQVFQTISVANANAGAPETFNAMKQLAESQLTTLIHQVERYGQRMQAETERGVAAIGNFVGALAARPGRKAVIYVSDGVEMRPGEELFYAMEEMFQGGRNLQVRVPTGGGQGGGGGGQGGGAGQGQGGGGGGVGGGGGGGNLNSEETINTLSFVTRAERFSLSKRYRELTALANTHQVSFYTIDARASLGGAGADASMSGTVGRLESGGMRAVRNANRWETLGVMAEDTGGLLMTGADVAGLFDRVATDFIGYYSLGYVPPSPGDGRPHKIKVKVKKRGSRLRYRQSYIAQNLGTRLADRTTGTLLLEEDWNPHGMSLETLAPVAGDHRGELLVPLLVRIPLRNVTLLPRGEKHASDVRLFITASSPDGFAGPVQEVPFQIEIPNEELGMATGQDYSARVDLVVRPGKTLIAVGLMDDTGGEGSFVRHEVMVDP